MDIDGTALAGMIFSLLCLLLIGGFILMYPLTRRLGQLMEQRLEDRKSGLADSGGVKASAADVEALREALRSVQAEVGRLGERQQFLERLLESGDRTGERAER